MRNAFSFWQNNKSCSKAEAEGAIVENDKEVQHFLVICLNIKSVENHRQISFKEM